MKVFDAINNTDVDLFGAAETLRSTVPDLDRATGEAVRVGSGASLEFSRKAATLMRIADLLEDLMAAFNEESAGQ